MEDKKAQQTIDSILSRDQREKKAFLDRLGKDYPQPRAEMEGDAFVWLRQWWSPAQIEKFIVAYSADEMVYPGIINTSKGPGLEKYMIKVGHLAFGAYARTLPRAKMLEMVAGREAAHGTHFGPKPERLDPFARVMAEAFASLREEASVRRVLEYMREHHSRIIGDVDEGGTIYWNSKGKRKTMERSTFRDRCTRMRKKIRK